LKLLRLRVKSKVEPGDWFGLWLLTVAACAASAVLLVEFESGDRNPDMSPAVPRRTLACPQSLAALDCGLL